MTEMLFGFYLAEIYGIAPSTLGKLLFVFLVWDAITDPLLAAAVSGKRLSTNRLLKLQFYGSILSSASFFLVFFKPGFDPTGLTLYALFVGLLFRTSYTIFDVPQNALMARLAQTGKGSLTLSSLRAFFSAAATLTLSFSTAKILSQDDLAYQTYWFTVAAIVFVIIAILSAFILQKTASWTSSKPAASGSSTRHVVQKTILNPKLFPFFGGTFFLSIGWPLFGKLVPFFALYVAARADLAGYLFGAIAIATLLAQPILVALEKVLSRRMAIVAATVINSAACILFPFIEHSSSSAILLATVGAIAASVSVTNVVLWAMLADKLADTGLSGANDVLAFGFFTFASKVALGIGGLLLGASLNYIGYAQGSELAPAGQSKLLWIMALAPALSSIVVTVFVLAHRSSRPATGPKNS